MTPIRILVVDDSALYRQSIQNVLREIPETLVVGSAKNGVEALARIEELSPDLLTLDVQMPDMDGIEVLRTLRKTRGAPTVVMVSSLTAEGARVTTEALMEGAFDFILKPSGADTLANRQQLRDSLAEKIQAFQFSRRGTQRAQTVGLRSTATNPGCPSQAGRAVPLPSVPCQLVMIGTSTGGPEALKLVLPKIAEQLPIPLLVVQHMPPKYTASLAKRLDSICPLAVQEAMDGMPLEPGTILLAPGGKQMKLRRERGRTTICITDEGAENGVRPSFDYLLRSAVELFQGGSLAIVLTGMGRDGFEGCKALKQAGGSVFAQDQADSVVYGMPKAVIEGELADRILTLGKVAPAIFRHIKRSRQQLSGEQA